VTKLQNGDVVFTPGTGAMGDDAPVAEPAAEDNQILTANSLSELVRAHGAPDELNAEERCLAGAVYFESKGESLEGQLAVARVVMARAKSGRFPSSLCGVVYQKSQFSFVRGGKMPSINTGSLHWRNAVAISQIALDGSWKSPVEGALFFHARYVSPGWRLKRIGSIDNHIFYR
jgi:spore germination cell wall hydrolase CwlJ-like protein